MYTHLFFDLDHTLWDFETNAKETFLDIYNTNHIAGLGITNFDALFERYSYHNERLWARYTKGFIKQEELRWKRIYLSLLDFKIANEPLAKELSAQFLQILPTKTNLFPYAVEVLQYLKNKGYQLHLITNGFEAVQYRKLQYSGLQPFFTQVITSEGSGSLKPKKEIFDYALQKANALLSNSIMIGDNIDADINGAINAGLPTIYVNHLNQQVLPQATHTIFCLNSLKQIL